MCYDRVKLDLVDEVINPEEPWSFAHIMNTIALVTLLYGAGKLAGGKKGGKGDGKSGLLEGMGSGTAKIGDTFGKMGEYVKNPGTEVDWSQYAEHGYERLAERGMSKELVNSIVRNGKALSQNGGSKFAFVTEEGVAVVSKEGKLITARSNKYYDEAMKEIIKALFGN